MLTERGLGGDAVDLSTRLEAFRRDRSQRADDARRLARGLARKAGEALIRPASPATFSREREKGALPLPLAGEGRGEGIGALLASAYPDRIAMARGKRGEFLMANGRAAALEAHDALAGEAYLAIGEMAGRAASARILLAAPLSLDDIETVAGADIETADELTFDRAVRLVARADGAGNSARSMLAEQTLAVPADETGAKTLAARRAGARRRAPAVEQGAEAMARPGDVPAPGRRRGLAGRFGRALEADPGLARAVPPRQDAPRRDRAPTTSSNALHALLPWDLARRLDARRRPISRRPTGTAAAIDYEAEGGPSIALRVQELFGLAEHPVGCGRNASR